MDVGKLLQPAGAQMEPYPPRRPGHYSRQTHQHPQRRFQIFTPDGLCPTERRGVEAKVVDWHQQRQWGDSADEIPERVRLQCWWYMSALDYPVWDVVALIGGRPRVYTVERDLVVEAAMLQRVEEWYERFIVGNERPPLTGSWESNRWLQTTYPTHRRPDIRPATEPEIELLWRYAEARVARQESEELCDTLANEIKAAIKEAEGIEWSEGRFTWRKARDSRVTDWQGLAWAVLVHFMKDNTERDRLVSEYTTEKPGFRRIHFTHADVRETSPR